MSDHFDMPALTTFLRAIRSREIRVVAVDTEKASPFASSLLFSYVAEFMYEGDQPLAERRAQALTLDRDLLAELLGSEDLRELLDPDAIAAVELELQGLLPERFPRDVDEAHDLLVRLGDLSDEEALARGVSAGWLHALEKERRAATIRIAGEARWIAAEDAGRYREAIGASLPIGLPEIFLDPGADPLESLLRRHARTHVPFVTSDPAQRWALPGPAVEAALARLASKGDVLAGAFRDAALADHECGIRAPLKDRGASLCRDLYNSGGGGDEDVMLEALWDLVWSGEVTNDTFAPLRLLGPASRRPTRKPRLPRLIQPRATGRWSLVADLVGHGANATERLHSEAGVLLQRHGVLTREAAVGEGWPGGFASLYPVLRAMEESGRIRRGYFVEGLGGSQFALPGAVDRLRSLRDSGGGVIAMAATDPANAFGTVLPWPQSDGRMSRAAGAYCVVDDGRLVLYLERGGRSLLTNGDVQPAHLTALIAIQTNAGRVELQEVEGVPV